MMICRWGSMISRCLRSSMISWYALPLADRTSMICAYGA